ncbi:hypothetical protein [Pseudomonas viridiflava]|uniref:hypothetical protein n=1 Tax=Pseudomonas viridiflava TaxID=33069 RepID=UPI0013CF3F61|nr:hypothetical protein [Pseudomonas viridiflava]
MIKKGFDSGQARGAMRQSLRISPFFSLTFLWVLDSVSDGFIRGLHKQITDSLAHYLK